MPVSLIYALTNGYTETLSIFKIRLFSLKTLLVRAYHAVDGETGRETIRDLIKARGVFNRWVCCWAIPQPPLGILRHLYLKLLGIREKTTPSYVWSYFILGGCPSSFTESCISSVWINAEFNQTIAFCREPAVVPVRASPSPVPWCLQVFVQFSCSLLELWTCPRWGHRPLLIPPCHNTQQLYGEQHSAHEKELRAGKENLTQFVFWENQDYWWTINYH